MPDNGKLPEVKVTSEGILVPLGTAFPGEYVIFQREWDYGDQENIGQWLPGTTLSMNAVLKAVRDWKITDRDGNAIVFSKDVFMGHTDGAGNVTAPDHTALRRLPSSKARAITFAALTAYNESGKLDPLAS